ncbi:unnamed protein product [Prunus armeniaca]
MIPPFTLYPLSLYPVTGTLSSSHRQSLCLPPLRFQICALRSSPSLLSTLLLQLGFVTPILYRLLRVVGFRHCLLKIGAFFQRLSKGTAITFNNSFGGQLKSKFCIPFGAHAAAFGGVRATAGHTLGCVTYVTGEGPNQP